MYVELVVVKNFYRKELEKLSIQYQVFIWTQVKYKSSKFSRNIKI